jgi:hypothetical protein
MMAAVVVVAVFMVEYRAIIRSHYRQVDANGNAWGPILREPYAVETSIFIPAIFLLLGLIWVSRKLQH